jgi:hypothetical protein
MTLDDAKQYISYGIKEGFFDPDTFCDETGKIVMKDDDLIKFAQEADARAVANYEAWEDEPI